MKNKPSFKDNSNTIEQELIKALYTDKINSNVTVKASQNLHKEKASCNRMLFSFNHFSTGHEAGTA